MRIPNIIAIDEVNELDTVFVLAILSQREAGYRRE